MPLTYKTSSGGGNFKSVPSGSHIAICNLMADLGLQPGSGLYPDPKQQVYIRFEVPQERVEYEKDGKKIEGPVVIGNIYTASMHEKANLRKQLEGWRGKKFTDEEAEKFDVSSILGKGCMLSVVETEKGGKIYSNIAAISGLPKGLPSQKAENPLVLFTEENSASFKDLPEWLQTKINGQLTKRPEPTVNHHGLEVTDDDIPF